MLSHAFRVLLCSILYIFHPRNLLTHKTKLLARACMCMLLWFHPEEIAKYSMNAFSLSRENVWASYTCKNAFQALLCRKSSRNNKRVPKFGGSCEQTLRVEHNNFAYYLSKTREKFNKWKSIFSFRSKLFHKFLRIIVIYGRNYVADKLHFHTPRRLNNHKKWTRNAQPHSPAPGLNIH